MSRSFIAGSVAGAALAVVSLASVSLMLPPAGSGDAAVETTEAAEAAETAATVADTSSAQTEASTGEGNAGLPETAMMEVPEGSEFARPKSDGEAVLPGTEAAPVGESAPAAAMPVAEPAPDLADNAPAAVPETPVETPDLGASQATVEASPATPAPNADDAISATTAPSPALPAVSEAGAEAPVPAEPEAASEVPAAPPVVTQAPDATAPLAEPQATQPPAAAEAPSTTETATSGTALPLSPAEPATAPLAEAPTAAPAAETAPSAAAEIALADDPLTQPAPASGVGDVTAGPTVDGGTAAPAEVAPAPAAAPETQPATDDVAALPEASAPAAPTVPEGAAEALPEILPVPDTDAAEDLPVPDESAMESAAENGKPRIITLNPTEESAAGQAPIIGLKRAVPGVKVNRLPTIGGATDEAATEAAEPSPQPVVGPLQENAAAFANPDGKPLLAIVLIDKGVAAGGLDPSALASLPFPATIAIDPLREDAATAASAYRTAGSEVAILAGDMPEGATPADFEVAYQSYVQALPQSVALIGLPDTQLQRSSLAAQHIAALLAADGRGLITFDQGLNPGRRAAEREGVPHAAVERLFGGAEDNAGTLTRELDRAAFTADQRGVMVIALPTTPEAVTALMAWAASPAAAAVAIAPASAVMLAGQPVAVPEAAPEPAPAAEPEPAPLDESAGSGSADSY